MIDRMEIVAQKISYNPVFTLKPEILCHPNIPKPLHGMAPRVIKGQAWWDKTRQEVYRKYDYHCIACGVSKFQAEKHKWLEAHEYWNIDYKTGICKIESIEPLCHYCHNFIHSGKLSMDVSAGEREQEEAIDILEHGFRILSEYNLKAFYYTIDVADRLGADTFDVDEYFVEESSKLEWADYKLIFEGKEYPARFKSANAWYSYYHKT